MNVYKNVTGIILSAGFSSRMNTPKALLELPITTSAQKAKLNFLEEIYSKMSSYLEQVIIVLGHNKDEILDKTSLPNAEIVYNENYSNGMFSSLKKALSTLSQGKAFMINPVDFPLVKQETYVELLLHSLNNPDGI